MSAGQPPESHAALILAIAASADRAAFAQLFAIFAPRLKAWLQRTGSEPALAEEMAQEAMLTVWRKAALYDPSRADPAAWIFAIARNLRIDALRRARLAPVEPELLPAEPLADAMLVTEERALRLRAAMAQLPADQAEALRLAFFEEFSHRRLETVLGLPLGTVKSRLRLAMARLRDALKDQL